MNIRRQIRAARFLMLALTALLAPVVITGRTNAQDASIVLASCCGEYTDAQAEHFGDPFAEATGTTVQFFEPAGGMVALLQAQVDASDVTWDIVDAAEADVVAMVEVGLLQPLPAEVKADLVEQVGEENVTDYGVSIASYSSVIACNAAVVAACPETPAEFWDVENFPGRRAMYGNGWSDALIYALQADGVAREDLFPLDVNRAFAKLDEIKPHIAVWWTTGDQSQQILRDEEVDMAILWDGRAAGLQDQGVAAQLSFDGSVISRDLLVVPADAPNPEAAWEFLRWYASHPEDGARWMEEIGYGVADPDAFTLIPAEVAAGMGGSPENMAKGVIMDVNWAGEHRDEVLPRWTEWLAS